MDEFSLGSHTLIGRLPDCDIVLDHPSSSRKHAEISIKDDVISIRDLGSVHGTFLNKRRLAADTWTTVIFGSHIRFGESQRIYILEAEESTDMYATQIPMQ